MLEELAQTEQPVAEGATLEGNGGERPAAKKGQARVGSRARQTREAVPAAETSQTRTALLSQSAAELRKRLGEHRDKAAEALQELLKKRQVKTVNSAEALRQTLEPAREFPLPAADLLRDAETLLRRGGWPEKESIKDLDKEELHNVRKAAKKARYLVEALPEDATLVSAALRFEALQEAGGQCMMRSNSHAPRAATSARTTT